MDHFIDANNASAGEAQRALTLLRMPYYLGGQKFRDDIYATYPSNFEILNFESCTSSVGVGEADDDGMLAAFQRRLYFGILLSVFREAGVEVEVDDFLAPDAGSASASQRFLSTAKLPSLLLQLKEKEASSDGPAKRARGEALLEALTSGDSINARLKASALFEYQNWRKLSASLHALYYSLYCAGYRIYGKIFPWNDGQGRTPAILTSGQTFNDSFVKEVLIQLGRCPYEAHRICASMPIDCQVFFASMKLPDKPEIHKKCTWEDCVLNSMDDYITRHATPGCQCASVSAPVDRVKAILDNGNIPIATWKPPTDSDDGRLGIEEFRLSASGPEIRYVAISHVWSDGMGNSRANALPTCQLTRLAGAVKDLYDLDRKVVGDYFTDLREKMKSWGEERIRPAERRPDWERFGESVMPRTIGFWMDTLCVPVRPSDREYRKLAIRRMRETYLRAEKVLVIDSYIETCSRTDDLNERAAAMFLSRWSRRLWTFQEGALARSLYFRFKDGPLMLEDLEMEARSRVEDGQTVHYERIAELSVGVLHSVRNMFLGKELSDSKALLRGLENLDTTDRMMCLMDAFRALTTSKPADEFTCAATLMGVDPGPILDTTDPSSRMALFLSMVGQVPSTVIFDSGPKCKFPGLGWAPSTFLNQHHPVVADDRSNIQAAKLSAEKRLIVTYPALVFRWPKTWRELNPVVMGRLRGSNCFVLIQFNTPGLRNRHRGQVGDEFRFHPDMPLAMILRRPINLEPAMTTAVAALVGEVEDDDDWGSRRPCTFKMVVLVSRVDMQGGICSRGCEMGGRCGNADCPLEQARELEIVEDTRSQWYIG